MLIYFAAGLSYKLVWIYKWPDTNSICKQPFWFMDVSGYNVSLYTYANYQQCLGQIWQNPGCRDDDLVS